MDEIRTGGTYIRDPETGELTRVTFTAATAAEAEAAVSANGTSAEPAKAEEAAADPQPAKVRKESK